MTTDTRELTEAQIREILAGTAGVTPGPWAYEPHGDTGDYGVGVLVGTEGEQPLRGYQTDSDNIVAETVAVEVNGPLNAAHVARLDPATVAALCNMALRSSGAEAKIAEQAAEIERLTKIASVLGQWGFDNSTLGQVANLENRASHAGLSLGDIGPFTVSSRDRAALSEKEHDDAE